MHLDVEKPLDDTSAYAKSDTYITTEHNGEIIRWNVLPRTNTSSRDEETGDGIFTQLNQYLSSLPLDRQEAIFNCFKRAKDIFNTLVNNGTYDVEVLATKLKPILYEMFELVPEADITDWVWYTLCPGMPSDIRAEFTSDMPGSIERTYLISDYRELIPMVIIVRLAFPIFMEYIHATKEELGKLHKESTTFTLLHDTWVYNSNAMRRLYVFVDHTVGSDKHNNNSIMSGISSENFIEWVLSFLVIRRIINSDIRGNANPSIISTLYNAIDTRVKQVILGGMNVRVKRYTEASNVDVNNNISILEGFRTKEAITTGDLAIFREYIQREFKHALNGNHTPHSLIGRIEPTLDKNLIQACYEVQKTRKGVAYVPIQIIMTMWLFSDYLSVRVAPHLNRSNIVALISLAQAIFIQRGKYDFAYIVGSKYRLRNFDDSVVIGDTSAAIPKQIRLAFEDVFPYKKRGGYNSNTSKTFISLPLETIDNYVDALKSYEITTHISPEINAFIPPDVYIPNIYSPPKNIRTVLAEFLMSLAHTPKREIDWETLKVYENLPTVKRMENQTSY